MEPRERFPISHGSDFSFSPTPYCEKILDRRECSTIAEIILQNEKYVKELGPDIYPGTSKNSLTGITEFFNGLRPINIPRSVQPIKLIENVPRGNPIRENCMNQLLTTYRIEAPIKPPAPTNMISFIQALLKRNVVI